MILMTENGETLFIAETGKELTTFFEGGLYYESGIYHTGISIMAADFVDEFNSVSRYLIWSKIQDIIGNEYSDVKEKVKAFVEYDVINPG